MSDSIVTTTNAITDLLRAPLDPDWTVENLAEQVLGTVAAQPPESASEFVIAIDETSDRQSRRLLRPLLAYLATKSASESGGTPVNLYGGQLAFKRPGPTGSIWVLGHFENQPGCVRVAIRRSNSRPTPDETGLASRDLQE